MVSRGSRIQPQPGKCCSTISCHTFTGIRKAASRSHGTGSTRKPPAPVNAVPENSMSSDTSPASRALKYRVAATSMSYVQGTARSVSVSPVKLGTMCETWAN